MPWGPWRTLLRQAHSKFPRPGRDFNGLGWAKSLFFFTGQCPGMCSHRPLMNAILHDKVQNRQGGQCHHHSLEQAPFLLSFSQKSVDLLLWRDPQVPSRKWEVIGSGMPSVGG